MFLAVPLTQAGAEEGEWQIDQHVLKARERGVLFDVGHGAGAFNWTVAEQCAKLGFWPDTISTDLHKVGGRLAVAKGRIRNLFVLFSLSLSFSRPAADALSLPLLTCLAGVGCWPRL